MSCTGSIIMVTTGSVIVTPVTPGSIIMVTTGSVIVTPGSVIVTTGSVIVTPGSVIVSLGYEASLDVTEADVKNEGSAGDTWVSGMNDELHIHKCTDDPWKGHSAWVHVLNARMILEGTSALGMSYDNTYFWTIAVPDYPSYIHEASTLRFSMDSTETLETCRASDEELEELIKDQLLPVDASPIALSSGYISDSDPEEDDEDDEEDEEEEEHLAPADPSAIPTDDPLHTIIILCSETNPVQSDVYLTHLSTITICRRKEEAGWHLHNNQNQKSTEQRGKILARLTAWAREEAIFYGRSKPLYFKYNYHHNGSCAPKCHKCNRVGHLTRDCRSSTSTQIFCPKNYYNQPKRHRASLEGYLAYECGESGHYRSEWPVAKESP
ncbi:reverse transcriptase domain-containing protein [Tanacetum coccineum]